MDRAEFDKIVNLAKAAHEATQKAKAAYDAYTAAASVAYVSQAQSAAKDAYEGSIKTNNFEKSLIETLNKDFNTSFKDSSSIHAGTTESQTHTITQHDFTIPTKEKEDNVLGSKTSTNSDTKSTTAAVGGDKPLKDLFTMNYQEDEKQESENKSDSSEESGWQPRV